MDIFSLECKINYIALSKSNSKKLTITSLKFIQEMKKVLFGTLILLGASNLASAQEKKEDKATKVEQKAEEAKLQETRKKQEDKLKAERADAQKKEELKQEQIKKEEAEMKAKEQSTPAINNSTDAAPAPEKAEAKKSEPVKETTITQRKAAEPRKEKTPAAPKAKAKPAKRG